MNLLQYLRRRMSVSVKRKCSGFTLVELLVAFSILGVAVIAVGGFLLAGVRSYGSVGDETNVQNEAQTAMNQIQETIIDASLGVSYNVQTTGDVDHFLESDSELPSGLTVTKKYVYVFNWNNDRSLVEALILKYDAVEKKLYYYELDGIVNGTSVDASGATVSQTIAEAVDASHISGWELLAEGVEEFSADLSNYKNNNQVTVSIKLTKNNKSYATSLIITLRNDVLINPNNIAEVYERIDAVILTKITGVDLTTSAYAMVKGGTVQLTTKVLGTGYPSQRIYEWKIESVKGVTVNKDTTGRISVNDDANNGTYNTLYDSLSSENSGKASISTSTKVLSLALDDNDDLLKITAIVYGGTDDDGNDVYYSDSEYIAVKDISTFTIQPDASSKTKYPLNNANLEIPNNPYTIASTSTGLGSSRPTVGDTSGSSPFIDVYPNNCIDMTSTLSGTNLDESDKVIVWSVLDSSEANNVTVSGSGVVTVSRTAQSGWAILKAYPSLNPNMVLYYLINIGTEYGESNNALVITGPDSINRGGSAQLGLTLNGYTMEQETMTDFNWSYSIINNSHDKISDALTTLSDSGYLFAGTTLNNDYTFSIVVKVSMKSNPNVNAAKIITVPRVTLTMTEPTLITKRGNTIPEGTTRCIVTGLETYTLKWTMASQTNPGYYNSLLPNGSHITGNGDTCSIYISGSEPKTLTYMRARAELADNDNYYAETYLSLADVSLSVTGISSVNRGGSGSLTANLNPSDSGFDVTKTSWSIKNVKDSDGKNVTYTSETLALSAEKGKSVTLNVASSFTRSDKDVTVTVQASLNGITAEKDITVKASETFNVTAGSTSVKRGGTVNVTSNYGTEVTWEITGCTHGTLAELSLVKNADGSCTVTVPKYFDTGNNSDTYINVQGSIDGTNISKTCRIQVTQVSITIDSVSKTATNNYGCSASVNGFASPSDYTINWALSSSNDSSATAKTLSGITFMGLPTGAQVNINTSSSSAKEFYVVAYVTVTGTDSNNYRLDADTKKVSMTGLIPTNQIKTEFSQSENNVECFCKRKNEHYEYCVCGYYYVEQNSVIEYYRIFVWSWNKQFSNYSYYYGPNESGEQDYYYLAYDTSNEKWYLYKSWTSDDWSEISTSATVNGVFGFKMDNSKALDVCKKLHQDKLSNTPQYLD